jgi:hypothetical protein
MKNSKAVINTYPTIYLVDLAVANKHVTIKQLRELYSEPNGEELEDVTNIGECVTMMVRNKKTNNLVSLVKYCCDHNVKGTDKNTYLVKLCSHEASHVVLDIYNQIHSEVNLMDQEPFAYFLGWVTERIYETLRKQ